MQYRNWREPTFSGREADAAFLNGSALLRAEHRDKTRILTLDALRSNSGNGRLITLLRQVEAQVKRDASESTQHFGAWGTECRTRSLAVSW